MNFALIFAVVVVTSFASALTFLVLSALSRVKDSSTADNQLVLRVQQTRILYTFWFLQILCGAVLINCLLGLDNQASLWIGIAVLFGAFIYGTAITGFMESISRIPKNKKG